MFAEIIEICGKDEIHVHAHKDEKINFIQLFATLDSQLGIEAVDDDGLMVPVFGGNEYAFYQFRCGDWVYQVDEVDIRCLREIQFVSITPFESFSEWVDDMMYY